MSHEKDDDAFREFLNREADLTTSYANFNELIEFAFGELESAVEAFERIRGKKYETHEEYLEDESFQGFVSDEFDDVMVHATDEEMAKWAFGSVEEADEEFGKREEDGD